MKPIPSAPGYFADAAGDIWSSRSGELRRMRCAVGSKGYRLVNLMVGGSPAKRAVHRLVAEAFHGVSASAVVRHLDGNRLNNRPSNLAWGTALDNARDRDRHGTTARGWRNPARVLTPEIVAAIRSAASRGQRGTQARLARSFGMSKAAVSRLVNHRSYQE